MSWELKQDRGFIVLGSSQGKAFGFQDVSCVLTYKDKAIIVVTEQSLWIVNVATGIAQPVGNPFSTKQAAIQAALEAFNRLNKPQITVEG